MPAGPIQPTTIGRELIEAPATIIAVAIFLGAIFAICGG